jgi:hypothetical protein
MFLPDPEYIMYENLPELKSGRYYSRILGKPDGTNQEF